MKHTRALLMFGLATSFAIPVFADSPAATSKAGTKGHVAAYDNDQKTVLDVQQCDAQGLSFDYVECGKSLRSRVDAAVCKKKGKGDYEWYYQISDGSKSKRSVHCDGAASGSGSSGSSGSGGSSGGSGSGSSSVDTSNAGKKGYATAYDADQKTVLDVQKCDVKDSSHDYVSCGKTLRDRVDKLVCKNKGTGKQTWYYQVSDSTTKSTQTVKCD